MKVVHRSNAIYLHRCKSEKTQHASKCAWFCQATLLDKVTHLITHNNKITGSIKKEDKDQWLRNEDNKTTNKG